MLSEGAVTVASAADLRSGRYPWAMSIVSRDDLLAGASGGVASGVASGIVSDHELAEIAAKLDAGISNLGG